MPNLSTFNDEILRSEDVLRRGLAHYFEVISILDVDAQTFDFLYWLKDDDLDSIKIEDVKRVFQVMVTKGSVGVLRGY